MLVFRYIRAQPNPLTLGWRLQFYLRGARPGMTVYFERSDGPEGPWEEIGSVPWDVYVFEDPLPTRGFSTRYFWRLTVLEDQGGSLVQVIRSLPITFGTERARVLAEWVRQHQFRLRGFNQSRSGPGRTFACYKRGSFGQPCRYCSDPDTNEEFDGACDVCKGTRQIESWTQPVVFPGYFRNPFVYSTSQGILGRGEELTNTLVTADWPILEPGDVIAERWTGTTWKVLRVSVTQPDNIVVTQNADVEMVNRDLIEASLAFPESSL